MRKHATQARDEALAKAEVLIEALPWVHKHSGETIVVKYGGAAMEDESLMRQVIGDLEMLKLMGMRVVLVHGGGKAINKLLSSLQLPVAFKDGLRVTDDATMEAVQMVLIGKVNQQLVWEFNRYGDNAVGVSGADGKTFVTSQADPDLGRVGEIDSVNTHLIEAILDDGYVPVIASVGSGEDGFYNVNADVAASKVAQALGAHTLVYLTDVDGLYRDRSDEDSVIAYMTKAEAHDLLDGGTLESGMIPKIRSIVEALDSGVSDVRILNGTFPHALLLEIFTNEDVGTMFVQGEE